MCGPWAAMIGQGVGMMNQAGTSRVSNEYQQDMIAQNTKLLERARLDSILYGATAAGSAVEQGTRTISEMRARAAGSGVSLSSEGVVGLAETTREYSQLDAETIKNNALREALGYSVQESALQMQSRLSSLRADMQAKAAYIGGFSNMMPHIASLWDSNPSQPASIGDSEAPWYMGGGFNDVQFGKE